MSIPEQHEPPRLQNDGDEESQEAGLSGARAPHYEAGQEQRQRGVNGARNALHQAIAQHDTPGAHTRPDSPKALSFRQARAVQQWLNWLLLMHYCRSRFIVDGHMPWISERNNLAIITWATEEGIRTLALVGNDDIEIGLLSRQLSSHQLQFQLLFLHREPELRNLGKEREHGCAESRQGKQYDKTRDEQENDENHLAYGGQVWLYRQIYDQKQECADDERHDGKVSTHLNPPFWVNPSTI